MGFLHVENYFYFLFLYLRHIIKFPFMSKAGRKKKTPPERRSAKIEVYMTDEEKRIIQQKAKGIGLSGSTYLKEVGLNHRVHMLSLDSKQVLFHAAKLGNNLNQIAREVNRLKSTNVFSIPDSLVADISSHLPKTLELIRELNNTIMKGHV